MVARRTPRPVLFLIGSVIVALAGCGTGDSTPSPSEDGQASIAPSAQTEQPTAVPTASASTPLTLDLRVGCSDTSPCALSAGTWTLGDRYSFILGMKVTLPDGWQSQEQDAGEFNLWPLAHPNDHILMVKDIAAVKTDGSLALVPGVPQTVKGLTAYWRQDPNLVVSRSKSTTIAGGIDAITYVIHVSPDAAFTDPECPVYPRCADLFTDPRYWDGVYGIGAPSAVRLYLATVKSGTESHLFVIGLEGEDDAALARLTKDAAPIIASIRLPDSWPTW